MILNLRMLLDMILAYYPDPAIDAGTSTGGVPTSSIGLDPKVFKYNPNQNQYCAWWDTEPDLAYVQSLGGVANLFSNQTRPKGNGYDIGAYESGQTQVITPVSGVSISGCPASTIGVGAELNLVGTVSPSNATNKNVTWTSSNTSIATVNSSGQVTILAQGTSTITVLTVDGNKSANCVLNASGTAPASTKKIQAENGTISGSGVSILTEISGYEGVGYVGSFTNNGDFVNVTFNNVVAGSYTLNIRYHVWGQQSNYLSLNGVNTAHNWPVASGWTTKSLIINLVNGTNTIGLSKDWGYIGTDYFEIVPQNTNPTIAVNGISLNTNTLNLATGASSQLTATVLPTNATNKSLTWSSSNPSVASVSNSGLVTALSSGTSTITATTQDGGFTATAGVVVASASNCNASGTILMLRYNGISGTAISNLTSSSNYPNNPSSSLQLSAFEIASNTGDNYGVLVSGYLCAPETGTYYFWVAGDDSSDF